jgi:integrase
MSVYKRKNKNGSFTWWFTKTISGVRYRRRIPTARTKAQAEEAERDYLSQIHDESFGKLKGNITLKEFFDQSYLKWAKENKRSWQDDVYRVRAMLAVFGNKRLCDITPFAIESYKRKRLKTPIVYKTKFGEVSSSKERSPAVVNRELTLLSAIFRVAIKKKQAATNPCHEVEMLKGEKNRKRYMTYEEEERLMPVLIGDRAHLRDMVMLAIYSGVRQGELFNLAVNDVDTVKMEMILRETKNGEPRNVPLNSIAEEIVLRRLAQAKADNHKFLFTNPATGKKYVSVLRSWGTACRLTNISDLHFHDLRHTFGTRSIENGATLPEVKEVMGHKSIQTTEGYVHATEKGKKRAVEALLRKPGHITVTREDRENMLKLVNG